MTADAQAASLADSITLVADHAAKRGLVLNRTKLVKILYFLDLTAWNEIGRTITGVEWRCDNYGPYAADIVETCTRMSASGELAATQIQNDFGTTEYRLRSKCPRYFQEPSPSLVKLVDGVVGEYGLYIASTLRDLSYKTEPMLYVQTHGHRGDLLEFPAPAPGHASVRQTVARYARLARNTEGVDSGDTAAALREDIQSLQAARAAATRRMLGGE